jgi:hypothetical protein
MREGVVAVDEALGAEADLADLAEEMVGGGARDVGAMLRWGRETEPG